MSPDFGNAFFEAVGGVLTWINVRQLWRDKQVKGVIWPVTAFWACCGIWNLYYYPSLGQWASFAGGLLVVSANVTWVGLALHYRRKS